MWLASIERCLRPDEVPKLKEWLRDTLHREVIVDRGRLWHGPEVVAVLEAILPNEPYLFTPLPQRHFLRKTLMAALALATVTIAVLAMLDKMPGSTVATTAAPALLAAAYQSPADASRQISLPDGSKIIMNPATRISASFGPKKRDVLLTAGGASFEVAREQARPFRVFAARRRFSTDEAQFNLSLRTPERAEITVVVGRVELHDALPRYPETAADRRDAPSFGGATLGPSESAIVERGWHRMILSSTATR